MSVSSPYLKFGYRRHSGGLDESLRTKVYIRSETFMNMLLSGQYVPYGYDERCNQVMFLSRDSTTWLFIEVNSL